MKIITLVENTSSSPEYKHKHGLSFYIETGRHKILFDLGSSDLFIKNAAKLNVNIEDVDTVIISHGHKDHGGALKLFLQKNQTARVYIRKNAFEGHYAKVLGFPINYGLDSSLKDVPQLVLTDEKIVIDDELMLFADVNGNECYSLSNNALYTRISTGLEYDDFAHEQNLIISGKEKHTLIAGCAHRGIINIKKRAEEITGTELHMLISGFHLYNPVSKKYESNDLIKEIAGRLKKHSTRYFTCHCTGEKAFAVLKGVLGEQIGYLSTGSSIEF